MVIVLLVVAYAAALPAALIWEVATPTRFHERSFSHGRWLSYSGLEGDNGRGEMYDDLVARRLLAQHDRKAKVVALLGAPDEVRGRRRYWLTGRWHNEPYTCLVVVFDHKLTLVRYGILKLTGRANLTSDCAGGTLLPESQPHAATE
jgi:hypothetical protein